LKNRKIKIVKSKDNIEYQLTVFDDVIALKDGQIHQIKKKISTLKSAEIESGKGIPIFNIPLEQSTQVIGLITEILKEFKTIEEIVESGIIDYTSHAEMDRKSDTEICIARDWNHESIDYEIAEAIKRSYRVEQIRIRFDPKTKKNWPSLGFTILGLKGKDGAPAKLVIYFENDPVEKNKTIMVVTILKPDY